MERNTNEYSDLFFHCVDVLNQYDEEISEETFLEEYFRKHQVRQDERVFFNRVFIRLPILDLLPRY